MFKLTIYIFFFSTYIFIFAFRLQTFFIDINFRFGIFNTDKEVDALYQHRLIDIGEAFPVYVEMRARESLPDEFRQCVLTFAYLNLYFMKANDNEEPKLTMERVNLDTFKG